MQVASPAVSRSGSTALTPALSRKREREPVNSPLPQAGEGAKTPFPARRETAIQIPSPTCGRG